MIGELQVARRGRHRKPGHRHPGGRLVHHDEHRLSPRVIAASMPHRQGLPDVVLPNGARLPGASDQRAESELGRMCLHGQISETQLLAGQGWASIVGRYRAVIAGPRPLAGTGRGFDCKGEELCNPCACRAASENYSGAFAALGSAGHIAAKAVNQVAVWDRPCPYPWKTPLLWGLSALAGHFGLTNRRK